MSDMIRFDQDFKEQQQEEERLAMEESLLNGENLSDSDESQMETITRPMSGKEARQTLAGKLPLEADR